MATADKVLKDALILKPTEKAELTDKLLFSLDKPDVEHEAVWAKEAVSGGGYIPGQRLYLRTVRPAQKANVVLKNGDPAGRNSSSDTRPEILGLAGQGVRCTRPLLSLP